MGDEIQDYLQEGLKRGFSIETLKSQLIKGGWPVIQVESAAEGMEDYQNSMQTSPPSTQKQFTANKNEIPIGVKISSYLYYLIAAIIFTRNIIYMTSKNPSSSLLSAHITGVSTSSTGSLILSFVVIIIPILFARGIWKGKNGYRIFAIITAFLVLVGGIISLLGKISPLEIVNLVIAISLIIFLLIDKKTREWFKLRKKKQ